MKAMLPALAMLALGSAEAVAAPPAPTPSQLTDIYADEIDHAIDVNRLLQARLMIGYAAGLDPYRRDRALGRIDLAEGRFPMAFDRLRPLLQVHPDDAVLLEAAGIAAAKMGRGDARDLLARATAIDAQRWKAWNTLGVLADLRRDWRASADAFGHALTVRPNSPVVLNNLAYSLMLQSRAKEAIPLLERAIAAAGNSELARDNLTVARAMNGDYPNVAGLPQAEAARAFNNAGYGFFLRGDVAIASSLWERAIETSPVDYPPARANLALIGVPPK
jgi:Flp pilus assembly protein TadD